MGSEDEAEFAAYVAARRAHVRRAAFLLCRDWHRADDLTQVAFVKLYGAWHTIRDKQALDGFVRSCLVRAMVDETRRPWRREAAADVLPERPLATAPAGLGGAQAISTDPAASVPDRDVMRQALDRVPLGQRAVLTLRFYEGLDVAATAQALGCSEGNVKSQTARGLQALKAALGPEGLAAFGVRQTAGDPETGGGERG